MLEETGNGFFGTVLPDRSYNHRYVHRNKDQLYHKSTAFLLLQSFELLGLRFTMAEFYLVGFTFYICCTSVCRGFSPVD